MAPRTQLYVLAVPLALFAITGTLGAAFSPYLLVRHPLLLIALSPLLRHLVLVAPTLDPVPFYVVAVARLFAADPFVYVLGRRYGHRAVEWMEARSVVAGRLVRWLERIFAKAWPVALFVSPGITVCTLSGAARVPPAAFVAINLAGTLTLVTLVRVVGGTFSDWILILLRFVEAHITELTMASVALALLFGMYWRRRLRSDVIEVQHLGDEDS